MHGALRGLWKTHCRDAAATTPRDHPLAGMTSETAPLQMQLLCNADVHGDGVRQQGVGEGGGLECGLDAGTASMHCACLCQYEISEINIFVQSYCLLSIMHHQQRTPGLGRCGLRACLALNTTPPQDPPVHRYGCDCNHATQCWQCWQRSC